MSGTMYPPAPHTLTAGLVPLYDEAVAIADASPASACALLRLVVKAVVRERQRTGRDLARDITTLVDEGAPVSLLRALDVIGLSDEHSRNPGAIDLAQGHTDVQNLFMFVNLLSGQE